MDKDEIIIIGNTEHVGNRLNIVSTRHRAILVACLIMNAHESVNKPISKTPLFSHILLEPPECFSAEADIVIERIYEETVELFRVVVRSVNLAKKWLPTFWERISSHY